MKRGATITSTITGGNWEGRDISGESHTGIAFVDLDLSEAETATVLSIRPGTVKSRLARGLERLRGEL